MCTSHTWTTCALELAAMSRSVSKYCVMRRSSEILSCALAWFVFVYHK